jgi:AcrR family transcriptional regulator
MAPSRVGDAIDVLVKRYLRREPKQSRSRALVAAVVEATDEILRGGAPIEQLTVERVSERAGIAMGSFYEYFGSKDSVLGVLVGQVTRSNFEVLARKLDTLEHPTLDALVHDFGRTVAATYLAHPNRTRVILEVVGRLGLSSLIHEEKDRFARVMAVRAHRFLPNEPLEKLVETMRFVADANMGVMVFAALRGDSVDVEYVADEISVLAMGVIRRRHPEA